MLALKVCSEYAHRSITYFYTLNSTLQQNKLSWDQRQVLKLFLGHVKKIMKTLIELVFSCSTVKHVKPLHKPSNLIQLGPNFQLNQIQIILYTLIPVSLTPSLHLNTFWNPVVNRSERVWNLHEDCRTKVKRSIRCKIITVVCWTETCCLVLLLRKAKSAEQGIVW